MWQSNYIETDSLKLHYTRTSGSKPPIVLAHGITDDGLCWTPVAEVLESDYDVIMVDARGHGRSDSPETGHDWITHAKDIHAVIQGLALHKPLILGHSMGAMTALVFAGLHPDVPKAILLEDPPSLWMPSTASPEETEARRAGMQDWLVSLKDKTREELIEDQRQETPQWSQQELELWADSKLRVRPNALKLFVAGEEDWPGLLANITCPVLLITADPDRFAIVTSEAAERLQSLLPQVQIAHIANAGHCIHRDQFDDYMGVVKAYLDQF